MLADSVWVYGHRGHRHRRSGLPATETGNCTGRAAVAPLNRAGTGNGVPTDCPRRNRFLGTAPS
jgi:hypothetical protein